MSTSGVVITGRRRRRLSAASLARFASTAWDPQSYRNLLYLLLALPLGVAYVAILAAGLSAGTGLAVILVGLVLLLATLFAVRSVTKSVVSALTGIALRDAVLPGTTATIASFLPSSDTLDAVDSTVTVRNLLTMTSGYQWDET